MVDDTTIQIAVGCDDGYARHLGVLLLSLFRHNALRPVQVHVMVSQNFASKAKLDKSLGDHAQRLTYYVIASETVQHLKHRANITAATYYRLLMSRALPSSIRRVIYLDCDVLIKSDLTELWQMPLGGNVAAASADPGFAKHDTLGLQSCEPYFNAGVMLIDLARWRFECIGETALDFAARHPERLSYDDQCALNWAMRGKWMMLDPKWNLQALELGTYIKNEFIYWKPRPSSVKDARIVHFNEPGRPWLFMDDHPFKSEYLAYKKQTLWRDEVPVDRYPHNMIIKALRQRAPFLLPLYLRLRRWL